MTFTNGLAVYAELIIMRDFDFITLIDELYESVVLIESLRRVVVNNAKISFLLLAFTYIIMYQEAVLYVDYSIHASRRMEDLEALKW